MTDKELLRAIGLDDGTITIGLDDEYAQMMLEKKIDSYLKKLDEEKKKEDMIEQLKHGQESFKEKQHLVEMLKSNLVYSAIKDMLIKDGFSFRVLLVLTCLVNMEDQFKVIQRIIKNKR